MDFQTISPFPWKFPPPEPKIPEKIHPGKARVDPPIFTPGNGLGDSPYRVILSEPDNPPPPEFPVIASQSADW